MVNVTGTEYSTGTQIVGYSETIDLTNPDTVAKMLVQSVYAGGSTNIYLYTSEANWSAEEITNENTFTFTKLSDDTYSVSAGRLAAYVTDINIPETYQGVPVTQIAKAGFKQYRYIETVTLPKSITVIGDQS